MPHRHGNRNDTATKPLDNQRVCFFSLLHKLLLLVDFSMSIIIKRDPDATFTA